MKLISQISDLKAVSGGYIDYEFVTENTIFYRSVFSAAMVGVTGGFIGVAAGAYLGALFGIEEVGAIVLGLLGAAEGAHLGYYYNEYSDIEPNTWVRWEYY